MNKIWIFLAFLATIGKIAYTYDIDTNSDYDNYEWGEDNFDSSEYVAEETKSTESDKQFDIQEYQIEDNRSELNEYGFDNIVDDTSTEKNAELQKEVAYLTSNEVENLGIDITSLHNFKNSIFAKDSTKSDIVEQNLETGTTKDWEFQNKIFEDTKAILDDETENDFADDGPIGLDISNITNLDEITKETMRLLDETQGTIDEENKNDDIEKDQNQVSTEEDTVDAAYEDLMADLNKLHETWSKLNDFGDNDHDLDNVSSDFMSSEEDEDYEETDGKNEVEQSQTESTTTEKISNDSTLEKETKSTNPILYFNDALPASEFETTDSVVNVTKSLSTSTTSESTISKQELILRNTLIQTDATDTIELKEITQTTSNIEDLSSTEVDELMSDFASKFEISEITPHDIRMATNIWLTVNKHTAITSPNFPYPYPTSTITDWMITGDGVGIELIISNFTVNGHVGDYLLFKPGGVNETGSTGLLFSFTLRNERRFRFLDVDKMFVRFVATNRTTMQILRGFTFDVRMVVPRPGRPEPEPEPEPTVPEPPATITLNLGGLSLEEFILIEEQFRQIVAAMAAMYIKNNNIPPGINTTSELTQITSRALCFHNWPKFERCVEVRFGVPIVYDDDEEREPRLNATDLTMMWETYSRVGDFAKNLSLLGITDFQVPNDRGILKVWLVIAAGVVLSMAMLAFALWRFSCFENYTRMPSFSDTESVAEKGNLDLFPTPHQPLPPLYSETDYQWADAAHDDFGTVGQGGFSNDSFVQEDLYASSDEEIVPANARNTSFSPRDLYSV